MPNQETRAVWFMRSRMCCEFIADSVIILSLISLLFRRCYSAAVTPLFCRCYLPLFRPVKANNYNGLRGCMEIDEKIEAESLQDEHTPRRAAAGRPALGQGPVG